MAYSDIGGCDLINRRRSAGCRSTKRSRARPEGLCPVPWGGQRRDTAPNPNAPSFQKITDVPGMTAIALNVALQSPHKTMPNLMFEPDELRDLVAYILSIKTRE